MSVVVTVCFFVECVCGSGEIDYENLPDRSPSIGF